MNLTQLSVFREVMKTGSMSQAAINLGRTQPAISLALKSLESALGIVLFERDTRNLKPVPEAYYLLSEADSVLTRMAHLERTMQRMMAGGAGELHLAAMPGVATALFPEFLVGFTRDRPDVSLSLHSRSSTQLRELVSSQGIDMGFGDYEEDHSRIVQTQVTVIAGNSFLALPAAHPLARRDVVPLGALSGEVIGTMQPEHTFEKRRAAAFGEAGTDVRIRFRSQTVLPLLRFVSAGQCCAIVDPLTVASAGVLGLTADTIVFRKVETPVPYDYAVLVPVMRPLSALARQAATAWEDHVIELLDGLGAEPKRIALG